MPDRIIKGKTEKEYQYCKGTMVLLLIEKFVTAQQFICFLKQSLSHNMYRPNIYTERRRRRRIH